MIKLILVRHGESVWNMENKFTGWTDVELSKKGIKEAKEAARLLNKYHFKFDIAYTSFLKRASDTLDYILKGIEQTDIEIKRSYKLNERHYGALQGLDKEETALKYGKEQVHLWRRSVDVTPPLLDEDDERNAYFDPLYNGIDKSLIPRGENLNNTMKRVVEYYESDIKKDLLAKKSVIVVAHGNSLRALIKYIDSISDEEIVDLEIKTGKPICYELDDDLKPINSYYLGEYYD